MVDEVDGVDDVDGMDSMDGTRSLLAFLLWVWPAAFYSLIACIPPM